MATIPFKPLFVITREISKEVFLSLFTPRSCEVFFCLVVRKVDNDYFAASVQAPGGFSNKLCSEILPGSSLFDIVSFYYLEKESPNFFFFKVNHLPIIEKCMTNALHLPHFYSRFQLMYEADLYRVANA